MLTVKISAPYTSLSGLRAVYNGNTLVSGGVVLNGTGLALVWPLAPGTYNLTVEYLGDGNDATSTSVPVTVKVSASLSLFGPVAMWEWPGPAGPGPLPPLSA